MLTRIPKLFAVDFVATVAQLDRLAALARGQDTLVRKVFIGTTAVCSLTLVPLMNGAGPVLQWATVAWPTLFGPVLRLVEVPASWQETLGSVVIFLAFSGICLRERLALRRCLVALEPLEPGSSVLDACHRMGASSPQVGAYLTRVAGRRPLRVGDWQVCRSLTGL